MHNVLTTDLNEEIRQNYNSLARTNPVFLSASCKLAAPCPSVGGIGGGGGGGGTFLKSSALCYLLVCSAA